MPRRTKTIRQKIMDVIHCPCEVKMYMTAADFHSKLSGVKLSSIASELCKMTNEGIIKMHPKVGPRGGKGYYLECDFCYRSGEFINT